jgi:hypothetical protein
MFRMVAVIREVLDCGILEDGEQPKHVAAKLGYMCVCVCVRFCLFAWASAASHGCTIACWLIVRPIFDHQMPPRLPKRSAL